MSAFLSILVYIIGIIILVVGVLTAIFVPYQLCKWFDDDLKAYYEGERERREEELKEKLQAKLKAYRDEEKRRKGIPLK